MSTPNPSGRSRADSIVAGLNARSLNAAIKRIAKAGYVPDKTQALDKQCEWDDRVPVLWALLRAGHLDLDDDALWDAMSADLETVDGADVVMLLRGIPRIPEEHNILPGWVVSLDRIVCAVLARDPDLLMAAYPDLPTPAKRGMATVLRRAGHPVEDTDLPEASALAALHLGPGHGLGQQRGVLWPSKGPGEIQLQNGETPGDLFAEYVGLFVDITAWKRAILTHALTLDFRLRVDRAWDAFLCADETQLVQLLCAVDTPNSSVWRVLTDIREDLDVDALIRIATCLADDKRKPVHADAAFARALTVSQASQTPSPAALAERLVFSGYHFGKVFLGEFSFRWRDEYAEAIANLPIEQARGLLEKALSQSPRNARAIPFVGPYLDDALWQTVVDFLQSHTSPNTLENWGIVATGLAMASVDILPRLELLLASVPVDPNPKSLYAGIRLTLLETLAHVADLGEIWPERYDTYLTFGLGRLEDYRSLWALPLQRALIGLPEQRLVRVFERGLDPTAESATRLRPCRLLATPGLPDTVIQLALDEAVLHGDNAPQPAGDCVRVGLDALGERGDPFLAKACLLGPSPTVAGWFRSGVGGARWSGLNAAIETWPTDPISRAQAISAAILSAHPDAECSTVFALRRKPNLATNALCRVDSPAIGVDPAHIPTDAMGNRMSHVLTLDLRAVGLQTPGSGVLDDARAVALFVRNPDDNEAFYAGNDDARVVAITDANLEAFPYTNASDGATLEVVPLTVPTQAHGARRALIGELQQALANLPGRAGGAPDWLVYDEDEDPNSTFILQFDDRVATVNLGGGRMFVFEDTAFWQN